MKHTFDYVAGRRYISKNPSVGRRCSLSKGNSFAIGMVVGAGLVCCIVNRKEIRNMLLGLINSGSRSSAPNKFSYGIGEFERNGCQINNHTTIFVFVNQTNVTNTTNITINSADSPHKKEDVRFSENNHTETSREPSSEDTVVASGSSVSQDPETVSPQSSGNPVSGQSFSGRQEPVASSVVLSTSTFCLPLDDALIKKLFDGMHGKYFHENTSLEQLIYVLTGRGGTPESVIPIEWIASSRCFALFIGIVCAPCWRKWKKTEKLFVDTPNLNKNLSDDFYGLRNDKGFVNGDKISPGLKANKHFMNEKDEGLKCLLVFLSGFSFF
jgi:hypothetical protein